MNNVKAGWGASLIQFINFSSEAWNVDDINEVN